MNKKMITVTLTFPLENYYPATSLILGEVPATPEQLEAHNRKALTQATESTAGVCREAVSREFDLYEEDIKVTFTLHDEGEA